MAEQRLDNFKAAGKLKGGLGGRPWNAQSKKRRKDRIERAARHQSKINWSKDGAMLPREVRQRLSLCVMRGGEPMDAENTEEGAAKIAFTFEKMLREAKRSCSFNFTSTQYTHFS